MQRIPFERPKLLHQRIVEVLRKEIASREAGTRFDSENELAKQFKVSVPTIRQALYALTREGAIERQQGKGTFVVDPLARRHVAVLLETDISHPRSSFFNRCVAQRLRQFFKRHGVRNRLYIGFYAPTECPQESSCDEFVESVAQGKLAGVVVVGSPPHPSWSDCLQADGVPMVGQPGDFRHGVGINFHDAVKRGVEYLLTRGRRNIALMGWLDLKSQEGQRLVELFRTTLKNAQAAVREEWICADILPSLIGAGWEGFREIWTARAEKPDGLLCLDDVMLKDAAGAIVELGIRVPQQLEIVTHTNKGSEIRYPFPTARMECDPEAFAQALGGMLLKAIRKQPVGPSSVLLKLPLVISEETINVSVARV